jgi:hypothetical protein
MGLQPHLARSKDRKAIPPLTCGLRPPFPDLRNLQAKAQIVRVTMFLGDETQYQHQIGADYVVELPKIHGVPAAILIGIVPGQQEVSDAVRLAGVALSDYQ